jgi:hypothetical protein
MKNCQILLLNIILGYIPTNLITYIINFTIGLLFRSLRISTRGGPDCIGRSVHSLLEAHDQDLSKPHGLADPLIHDTKHPRDMPVWKPPDLTLRTLRYASFGALQSNPSRHRKSTKGLDLSATITVYHQSYHCSLCPDQELTNPKYRAISRYADLLTSNKSITNSTRSITAIPTRYYQE